jgi:membrane-bound lytic murein transglycosylase B
MSQEHGIESFELERILGDVRYTPAAVRLIGPVPSSAPSPARSYSRYRERFLTPAMIADGSRFWSLHAKDLARAKAEFGIPPEVNPGHPWCRDGLRSQHGLLPRHRCVGDDRLDGERRQDYFRQELKELLLLARDSKIDRSS